MNPIFFAAFSAMFHIRRMCPKCKHQQFVAPNQRRETVKCKLCKAPIPPRK